ncbi:hypothetical protein B0T10DRAFT_415236, partial [Thelonectria olida]
EYRTGETCGLKLVSETRTDADPCKPRRRSSADGNRSAGEMHDILVQIERMKGEHEHRIQSLSQIEK